MKHIVKQHFIFGIIGFFLATAFIFLISSCKKCECSNNCDCYCENDKSPEYWEHFIAHAGGAMDGINYTNCVEALDLSYSKGCKLFELDLCETTDGKIVAAHDPPGVTEEEFMNTLIHGKYTPMNMQTINDWFRRHPDAILVTDKINNPQKIYDEFLFRDRVIMELFSWGAVDRAIELKIKPMASEYLIFAQSEKAQKMGLEPMEPLSDDELEQILKEKKIEYICMSRYGIRGRENLLKRLKNNGVKNYVYGLQEQINGQPAEEYVWNYEMKFCHGMYADNLDLLAALNNGQLLKKKK
jgi:glycerophosphoryl diester phosphodiesterase